MKKTTNAVVLLSGGLDSATTLAIAKSDGFGVYALSFDYGQRHAMELDAARRISQAMGACEHVVIPLDVRVFQASALTSDGPVPKRRDVESMAREIPATYVPARNTVFLSFALGWAEVIGASDIYLGVNALDYSGYPDCRPEYIAAFQRMADLATKSGVEGRRITIRTPLIHLSKAEIIRKGLSLGVDYSLTHSCYDPSPGGRPCGECDACVLRLRGFAEVGVPDPLVVRYP